MTSFRGFPACECLIAFLPPFERELQACGVLAPTASLRIFQLIGTNPKSGGTHATGGAFDLLDLPGDLDVSIARRMGADATWSRLKGWDGGDGIEHVHGVLTDCPHNGPARYQIDAVRAGFNGLGTGGRGGPDTGPRPLSGRTWREGVAWQAERAGERKRLDVLLPDLIEKRTDLNARITRVRANRKALNR